MLLLKAVEMNWSMIGPGGWEKRSWKVNSDGTYLQKTTFRPVDPEDADASEAEEEGALSEEQMAILKKGIDDYWSDEKTDACDGSAWEFKLYDNGTVVRHRDLGYIYGIEPYARMAGMLKGLSNEE